MEEPPDAADLANDRDMLMSEEHLEPHIEPIELEAPTFQRGDEDTPRMSEEHLEPHIEPEALTSRGGDKDMPRMSEEHSEQHIEPIEPEAPTSRGGDKDMPRMSEEHPEPHIEPEVPTSRRARRVRVSGARCVGRRVIRQNYVSGPPAIDSNINVNGLKRLTDDEKHISRRARLNPTVLDLKPRGAWRAVTEMYNELSKETKVLVNKSGFGDFLTIDWPGNTDTSVVNALVERWWDTTHTFHLPNAEVGITPLCFTMLTGISVGVGDLVQCSKEYETIEKASTYLPGLDGSYSKSGSVQLTFLRTFSKRIVGAGDVVSQVIVARAFLLYLLGQVVFPTSQSYVRLGYLANLVDLDKVIEYDWGSAMLGYIYGSLDVASRGDGTSLCAFYPFLQIWFYETFATMNPVLKSGNVDLWPRMKRWEETQREHVRGAMRCQLSMARSQLEIRTFESIRWNPWADSIHMSHPHLILAAQMSKTRMVLGQVDLQAWYLGDRCWMQTNGKLAIPRDPPSDMPKKTPGPIYSQEQMREYKDGGWFRAHEYILKIASYGEWKAYWERTSCGQVMASTERHVNVDIVSPLLMGSQIPIPQPPEVTCAQTAHGDEHHAPQPEIHHMDPLGRRASLDGRPSTIPIQRQNGYLVNILNENAITADGRRRKRIGKRRERRLENEDKQNERATKNALMEKQMEMIAFQMEKEQRILDQETMAKKLDGMDELEKEYWTIQKRKVIMRLRATEQ